MYTQNTTKIFYRYKKTYSIQHKVNTNKNLFNHYDSESSLFSNNLFLALYSETCLNRTLSKPKTCLNWTNYSVPKGFCLDRFYCICKCGRDLYFFFVCLILDPVIKSINKQSNLPSRAPLNNKSLSIKGSLIFPINE
jgi:hypothetical protein